MRMELDQIEKLIMEEWEDTTIFYLISMAIFLAIPTSIGQRKHHTAFMQLSWETTRLRELFEKSHPTHPLIEHGCLWVSSVVIGFLNATVCHRQESYII